MIVGVSQCLERARALSAMSAPTIRPVLLIGPTGTGKELFAREIHRLSGRNGRFLDVNCAAIPRELFEGQFFGHRRGAFTGAVDFVGLAESSTGGTLFLDEICSLDLGSQAKLLRFIETAEVCRLGETRARSVDLRIVAAAGNQLWSRVKRGEFRLDLLHRIGPVCIQLTPLEERPEDIVPLAEHFANNHGRRLGPGAVEPLVAHHWPGNVRELRAVIANATMVEPSPVIERKAIREAFGIGLPPLRPGAGIEGEAGSDAREHLLAVCRSCDWQPGRIAQALGVSRSTLFRRLRDAGVSLRERSRDGRGVGWVSSWVHETD